MTNTVDPLKTRNPLPVPVDQQTYTATITQQWFLENAQSLPPRPGCTIQTFIGGQNGFKQIVADMNAATSTIEMVCWGFDPGMALVRGKGGAAYPWARGEPLGEFLRRQASRGIKVRVLVWYDPKGSAKQNSLPGYVNPDEFLAGGVINRTWDEMEGLNETLAAGASWGASALIPRTPRNKPLWALRQDYCTHWLRQATSGQIPNLEIRGRGGVRDKVEVSLQEERDKPSKEAAQAGGLVHEHSLLHDYATHHQKPILIDYGQPGHQPVGYVMGLNATTDYWDTAEHGIDEPLREQHLHGKNDEAANKALKAGSPISRKPLQDYACRVQGPVLQDVWRNFRLAWNRAPLLPKLTAASNARHNAKRSADLPDRPAPPPVKAMGTAAEGGAYVAELQIARTQPEEENRSKGKTTPYDKSIKQLYFQACDSARNYLYLENQYFYYEEWASHLKAKRQAFMKHVQTVCKASKDARLLHLIAVIPLPEDPGMVPRTFDTVKSLGQADSMPGQGEQYAELDKLNAAQADWDARRQASQLPYGRPAGMAPRPKASAAQRAMQPLHQTAKTVQAPTLDPDGVLMQDGKSLGLKVLICKMVAPNKSDKKALGAARDIYIHSKLLLVDDCLMTLGSANLNQRSMAADSEINVVTNSIPHNRDLRKRVWSMQTGELHDGGAGTPTSEQMADTFAAWEKLAQANADAVRWRRSSDMQGFIVKFNDTRISTVRVA